ncbi:hypothetical protein ACUOA8_18280, partial [Escherichia sp. SS-MK2]
WLFQPFIFEIAKLHIYFSFATPSSLYVAFNVFGIEKYYLSRLLSLKTNLSGRFFNSSQKNRRIFVF